MQNLYDILKLPRTATNKEINAALRQLVRRYNEETAQGAMDSGEALKFVNKARLTFANPERRAQYDAELAAFEAEEARLVAERAEAERQAAARQAEIERQAAERQAEAERQEAARKAAEQTTQSDNSVVAENAIPVAPPQDDAMQSAVLEDAQAHKPDDSAKAPLTLAPETSPRTVPANFSQPENDDDIDSILIPIPLDGDGGRMTFVGTAAVDARVTDDLGSVLDTKGKKKQRTTAPDPGSRFAARLIDYGLWGLLLGLIVHFLGNAGILSEKTVQLLMNPFLAPIAITLTWAFVEAAVLIFFPATPGKYLLDIHVAANVSNPYASSDPGALLSSSCRRAFSVWRRGVAAGVFPIYIFALFRGRQTLLNAKETTWDFDSDCLVTHGKAGISTAAIVAVLVGGMVFIYSNYWIEPVWQAMNDGWRFVVGGTSTAQDTWKTLSGDLPTLSKEAPPAPAKEPRTIQLEKTMQELINQQDWKALSDHCLDWTKEDERNVDAWFCYGRARHELADHGGAITALKRARALDPANDDIRSLIKDVSLIDMQKKQLRKRGTSDQSEPAIDNAPEPEVKDAR